MSSIGVSIAGVVLQLLLLTTSWHMRVYLISDIEPVYSTSLPSIIITSCLLSYVLTRSHAIYHCRGPSKSYIHTYNPTPYRRHANRALSIHHAEEEVTKKSL
ncbi:hypothetical protein F4825DRAFT_262548 [Nemania diffusa]|nr:hypothetical protein F4825DRAFT_262548 [Nemania diffusa]